MIKSMFASCLAESTRLSLLRAVMVPLLNRCLARVPEEFTQARVAVARVRDLYVEGAVAGDPRWRKAAAAARKAGQSVAYAYAYDAVYAAVYAADAWAAYADDTAAAADYADAAYTAADAAHDTAAELKQQALDLARACREHGLDLAAAPVSPLVLHAVTAEGGRIEQSQWHSPTCNTVHCHAGWLVHLSPHGYAVEAIFGSQWTGAAVAVAELPDEPLPDFSADADPADVLADIRRRAGLAIDRND